MATSDLTTTNPTNSVELTQSERLLEQVIKGKVKPRDGSDILDDILNDADAKKKK